MAQLTADADGFIWVSDGQGLWRLDGRNSATNTDPTDDGRTAAPTTQADIEFAPGFGAWEHLTSPALPVGSKITRLARSPGEGWAMVSFSTGEILEVNVRPTSASSRGDGSSAGFGEPVSRVPALCPTWTQSWQEVARLPGGGNHDVFCTEEYNGEIFVAGGLTDWWGFPAATHVFDELWAYNHQANTWRLASRIPYGTCYCGLTILEGKVYVVGGADERAPGHRLRLPGSNAPADDDKKDFVR